MNKKYKPLIWLIVFVILAITFFVLAKNNFFIHHDNTNGTILEDGIQLSNSYFSDKIIVIHSLACPHCRIVVPILREIELEYNKTFYYYDMSKEEDLEKIKELKIVPKYIPTVIIYGKVYIGQKSKQDYLNLILK